MESFKVNLALISTIFLWGSAFVGIRMGLVDYSPGSLALLRFLVASICIAIIYYFKGIETVIPWRDRIQLLVAGMAGIGIYNICLNYGEITVSAGIASFVIGLMPVITILLSLIFLQEKLNAGVWASILISLLGLLLLAIGENSGFEMKKGILCILVSACMGAILTIMQKKLVKRYHPIAVISWILWGGTLFLLLFSAVLTKEIAAAHYESTLAIVYMGIFPGALAYLAWTYALQKLSAAKASISLYALPIVSTLLGFIVLDELPSLLSFVGGGIALLGALIANYYHKKSVKNVVLDKKVVAV